MKILGQSSKKIIGKGILWKLFVLKKLKGVELKRFTLKIFVMKSQLLCEKLLFLILTSKTRKPNILMKANN